VRTIRDTQIQCVGRMQASLPAVLNKWYIQLPQRPEREVSTRLTVRLRAAFSMWSVTIYGANYLHFTTRLQMLSTTVCCSSKGTSFGVRVFNAGLLAISQLSSGRSCDRTTGSRFSVVFVGPKANVKLVLKFPRCTACFTRSLPNGNSEISH
jgi:hypothetical protein